MSKRLTQNQVKTIKELKTKGVRISFIAKLLQAEGLALSAAYYHLSDNRKAYDNKAKLSRAIQRDVIKTKVGRLIDLGWTTGEIAEEWNIPLKTLNKIYTS